MKDRKEPILSLSKDKGDFTVETFRSGGPGGQNQNVRNSGVRIRHSESGATGESRTHRTQEKNKKEAFRQLVKSDKFQKWLQVETARRLGKEEDESTNTRNNKRVRTYHYPRKEVKDHRTSKTYSIMDIIDGDLDEMIEDLKWLHSSQSQ